MTNIKHLTAISEPFCRGNFGARGGVWVCFKSSRSLLAVLLFAASFASGKVAAAHPLQAAFLAKHCSECHDQDSRKGGLDFSSLSF